MAFEKGNKLGGRKPGSKNKVTLEAKEIINNILTDNLVNVQKDLDTLEPKERLEILLKLAKFVIPELKANSISQTEQREIDHIEVSFVD